MLQFCVIPHGLDLGPRGMDRQEARPQDRFHKDRGRRSGLPAMRVERYAIRVARACDAPVRREARQGRSSMPPALLRSEAGGELVSDLHQAEVRTPLPFSKFGLRASALERELPRLAAA